MICTHKLEKITLENYIKDITSFFDDGIDADFNGTNGEQYMVQLEDGSYISKLEDCIRKVSVEKIEDVRTILCCIEDTLDSDSYYDYVSIKTIIVNNNELVVSLTLDTDYY